MGNKKEREVRNMVNATISDVSEHVRSMTRELKEVKNVCRLYSIAIAIEIADARICSLLKRIDELEAELNYQSADPIDLRMYNIRRHAESMMMDLHRIQAEINSIKQSVA